MLSLLHSLPGGIVRLTVVVGSLSDPPLHLQVSEHFPVVLPFLPPPRVGLPFFDSLFPSRIQDRGFTLHDCLL